MRHQASVPERMMIVRTWVTLLEEVEGIGHIAKQSSPSLQDEWSRIAGPASEQVVQGPDFR